MNGLFSKRYLLTSLKQSGLPCTYQTLMNYEKKGIVLRPQSAIGFGNGSWRLYTKQEIDESVRKVANHRKGKGL